MSISEQPISIPTGTWQVDVVHSSVGFEVPTVRAARHRRQRNHFFLDAAAGAITVALAAASASVITRRPGHAQLARLPEQLLPAPRPERLAA
jgi:polyisoprenoid-binding protein YceI